MSTAPLPFNGQRVLVDNSVIARLDVPQIKAEWDAGAQADLIWLHPPGLLEARWSAKSPGGFDALSSELLVMSYQPFDTLTMDLAVDAQTQMAAHKSMFHRRGPLPDLLIAAAAHQFGYGVWHYDKDYDAILEATDLEFESHWAVPRGSIGPSSGLTPERALRQSLNNALTCLPDGDVPDALTDALERVETQLAAASIEVPERITP